MLSKVLVTMDKNLETDAEARKNGWRMTGIGQVPRRSEKGGENAAEVCWVKTTSVGRRNRANSAETLPRLPVPLLT